MKAALPLSKSVFDHELDDETIQRIDKAIDLYRNKKIDVFIITGGFCEFSDNSFTHASVMIDYLLSVGIPPEIILVDYYSLDTIGKAFFTARNILKKHDIKEITVITHKYHAPRTKEIFRFTMPKINLLFEIIDCKADKDTLFLERKAEEFFHRLVEGINPGDLEQIAWALMERHPLYPRENFVKAGKRNLSINDIYFSKEFF